jgi:glycosyltransferase involved in cell wall biosynthesis
LRTGAFDGLSVLQGRTAVLTCIVVPHYDHLEQFQKILPKLVRQGYPLVVVDDGSPENIFEALGRLLEGQAPGSILARHATNQGKGAAVMTGLKTALEAGFTHALQIDADGQHDIDSIGKLVAQAERCPASLICGEPVFDRSISRLRYYSRFITLYLVWLQTLSTEIHDALCGLRLYPLGGAMVQVSDSVRGRRMAFDPEVLVRAVWAGIPLIYVPVKIDYPVDGKSHFHYLGDNLEIAWMHTRLVAGMLVRSPKLIWRKLSRRRGYSAR